MAIRAFTIPSFIFQASTVDVTGGLFTRHSSLGALSGSSTWQQQPPRSVDAGDYPCLWHKPGMDLTTDDNTIREPARPFGMVDTLTRLPRVLMLDVPGLSLTAWLAANATLLDARSILVTGFARHDFSNLPNLIDWLPWSGVSLQVGGSVGVPWYQWNRGVVDTSTFIGGELLLIQRVNNLDEYQKAVSGRVLWTSTTPKAVRGNGSVDVSVSREAQVLGYAANFGAITVEYQTTGAGTATAGTDYTATSGTLRWEDGEGGTKTFPLAVFDVGADNLTIEMELLNASVDTSVQAPATISLTMNSTTGGSIPGSPPSPPPPVSPAGPAPYERNTSAWAYEVEAIAAAMPRFSKMKGILWSGPMTDSTEVARRKAQVMSDLVPLGWEWTDAWTTNADVIAGLTDAVTDFFIV